MVSRRAEYSGFSYKTIPGLLTFRSGIVNNRGVTNFESKEGPA